jgi:hypothetical protein
MQHRAIDPLPDVLQRQPSVSRWYWALMIGQTVVCVALLIVLIMVTSTPSPPVVIKDSDLKIIHTKFPDPPNGPLKPAAAKNP